MIIVCTGKGCQVYDKNSEVYKKLNQSLPIGKTAKKIRHYREEQRISLRKFAEKVDTTMTYLSKIEQGLIFPSDRFLLVIAKELGVSVDDLISVDSDIKA